MYYKRLTILFFLLYGFCASAQYQDSSRRKIDEAAYLKKAEAAAEKRQFREASWHLNEVAMQRWEANDYDSAVLLFNQSLEFNKKIDNKQGIFGIYSNLAMIHADMKEYEQALGFFEKTLEGRRQRGEKVGTISAHINISVVLNNLERHQEAAQHLKDALELAQEMNDVEQMRSCYGMLSETYEKAGEVEKSLEYFELYRTFHKIVQQQEVKEYKKDAEQAKLQAQLLETEKARKELALELKESQLVKKEKELAEVSSVLSQFSTRNQELLANASRSELLQELLRAKNKEMKGTLEAKELRIARETLLNQVLAGGILILVLVAALIYRNGRERKKQNRKLQRAIDAEKQSRQEAQRAYEQLQEAQAQLVHQEKMASLGQLTAGVAHEINNPLNFIYAGISVVKAEVENYEEVIADYRALHQLPAEAWPESLSQLSEKHGQEDIDESKRDISEMMEGVEEGSARVKEIVQSLQYFSRQRQHAATKANIHQCLDSTLMLLSNKTQDGVEVEKDYDEAMEDFLCYPSQINQVLMNVLVNAIQATEGQQQRQVGVQTECTDESIIVRIADNGPGIPQESLDSIFNPFFTTKDVGKGTGLGLSISVGIVKEHGGEIRASNREEGGALFELILPKDSPNIE